METLPKEQFLSSMQLGYTAECRAGETIRLLTGKTEEGHFVKGEDEEGKARFEVRLTFAPVPER